MGEIISGTCALARNFAKRISETAELELLTPVTLNIVCFRYCCDDADRVNGDIVVALQESGIAAPSTTMINGMLAIRVAIVNHRTTDADLEALLEATLAFGADLSHSITREAS